MEAEEGFLDKSIASIDSKRWRDFIDGEKHASYFQELEEFLSLEQSQGKVIYPPREDIFNAFKFTQFEKIKAVIIGQDPYHGPNQAHGLAFSVRKGIPFPPSLQNIFKELESDLGIPVPSHGCLEHWARQGVLLLNAVLTVLANKPQSHKGKGWEEFTDRVVEQLNTHCKGLVFLLWGASAQKKCQGIDREKHLVLTASHPSPLSANRGFFGCRHFSETNRYLEEHGIAGIDWSVL